MHILQKLVITGKCGIPNGLGITLYTIFNVYLVFLFYIGFSSHSKSCFSANRCTLSLNFAQLSWKIRTIFKISLNTHVNNKCIYQNCVFSYRHGKTTKHRNFMPAVDPFYIRAGGWKFAKLRVESMGLLAISEPK